MTGINRWISFHSFGDSGSMPRVKRVTSIDAEGGISSSSPGLNLSLKDPYGGISATR